MSPPLNNNQGAELGFNMPFSQEFKHSAVEKFINRGNRTIDEISKGVGTSSTSIYNWMRECGRFIVKIKPIFKVS
jgi:transposase-like protein